MTDSTRSSPDNAAANSEGGPRVVVGALLNALPLDKKTTSRFLWAQAEFTAILPPATASMVTVGGGASSVSMNWTGGHTPFIFAAVYYRRNNKQLPVRDDTLHKSLW